MTDPEINIAIAEWYGYSEIEDRSGRMGFEHTRPFAYPYTGQIVGRKIQIPDYTTDLNAMHEADKRLSEKQLVWYLQKLTQVCYKEGVGGMIACMIDKTTFANARQRAEALLRTIGKWKE